MEEKEIVTSVTYIAGLGPAKNLKRFQCQAPEQLVLDYGGPENIIQLRCAKHFAAKILPQSLSCKSWVTVLRIHSTTFIGRSRVETPYRDQSPVLDHVVCALLFLMREIFAHPK